MQTGIPNDSFRVGSRVDQSDSIELKIGKVSNEEKKKEQANKKIIFYNSRLKFIYVDVS